MKNIYLSFLAFCFVVNASAQFTGGYAVNNWSLTRSAGSNGSVNTSTAPASITITGSNGTNSTEAMNTDFTIVATSAGRWRFQWNYHTNDSDNDAQWDLAGVLINGVFTQLTVNSGGVDQSGSFTAPHVNVGDVIGFRVSAVDNIMGDATFTIQSFTPPGSVLPLTLTSFTAKSQGEEVLINWKTAEERHLSGFNIERSADGNSFQLIESVSARNALGTQSYDVVDAKPLAGTSYYRLRIKEQDGTERYSTVVGIKRSGVITLQVVPNPVKGAARIIINAAKAGIEMLEVVDATGRTIQQKVVEVRTGQQTFTLEKPLSKGIYFIRTKDKVVSFVKE